MAVNLTGVQTGAGSLARWSAILLGASIPISIAFDNVLCAVMLLAWAASGTFQSTAARLRANPVALIAVALWFALAVGLAWGERNPGDGFQALGKYADLLLVPVFATLFADGADRRRGLLAYAAAMLVTLVLSLALAAGLLPEGSLKSSIGGQPVAFKLWLTQNILMAFGAYICLLFGRETRDPVRRAAWWAIAAVAALNVCLLVQGRTGMLMLALLALYAAYVWRGWRALGAMTVAGTLAVAVAMAAVPAVGERIRSVAEDSRAWQPGEPTLTSTGIRLEFYRVSSALVLAHPLAGTGTGSFALTYREKVAGTALEPTRNPHNEYLLLAVQLGLGGPLLLLALWVALWRSGRRLPPLERDLVRGVALCFAVGCLLNSLLLDHTEGLLFAWLAGLATGGLPSATPDPDAKA
jgi:O-antigen ligase